MRYRDGYKVIANDDSEACGCLPQAAGYDTPWYGRIVSENGAHFLDGSSVSTRSSDGLRAERSNSKHRAVSKSELLQRK